MKIILFLFVFLISSISNADIMSPPINPCTKKIENDPCILYGNMKGKCKEIKIQIDSKEIFYMQCKLEYKKSNTMSEEKKYSLIVTISAIIVGILAVYTKWK